jgi:hypothetical protein
MAALIFRGVEGMLAVPKTTLFIAPLAQLVEQLTLNQRVEGSSPSWRTNFSHAFFHYSSIEGLSADPPFF